MIRSISHQFNASGLAAIVLLLLGLSIAWRGYGLLHEGFSMEQIASDFYTNGATELGSIAITVLVIETLNGRRAIRREKDDLILEMGSPDRTVAREAVRKLGIRGWLYDGSLRGQICASPICQK